MTSAALGLALLLQAPAPAEPVLSFPEPGLDDTSAYQGYRTRFYRDSRRNTVQVYLHPATSRVVLVWADAANESVGFSVRDAAGRPVRVTWAGERAQVADSGAARSIELGLRLESPNVVLGWFVLGSMRVERDFVYAERHRRPFSAPAFQVAEESLLVARVARLPPDRRRRHLKPLGAASIAELRARLVPSIERDGRAVRVQRPSLDRRNLLRLELLPARGDSITASGARTVGFSAGVGRTVTLRIRVTTDAAPLTPLERNEIFNADFLRFLSDASRATDSAGRQRYRRLERQVRAVELLSAREKLMAGLPNFGTYFGRDMMMSAIMMRPVWTPGMSEHVIASVLRKLGPGGQVSHEEALGGQAIREHAVLYDSLVTAAPSLLGQLQRTRENYHMIDDEYQLPVLVARWLADSAVPPERKRAFLLDQSREDGERRLAALLRELALVTETTHPYVLDPQPLNLVSFPRLDSTGWRSASWRDSDAGYAGGRFAMDVNAIWVPEALAAVARIFDILPRLGIDDAQVDSLAPGGGDTPLDRYRRDPSALRHAIETWRGARRHFEVTLAPGEIRDRLRAKLAWLPPEERRYWERAIRSAGEPRDSLTFLALALDAAGKPIPVVNTDPATGLFLGAFSVPSELEPFVRTYPVGLFVAGIGPLVANDAYASRAVWERFRKDTYHGPRVVWGREVNLLLLALANRAAGDSTGAFREALDHTLEAVQASGLEHAELWSYRIENGHLQPTRYGTTSDIQLWSSTGLAVQFALSKLGVR